MNNLFADNFPMERITGILYYSPRGMSEYAECGKRTISYLLDEGISVSWNQLTCDNSKNDESDPIYKKIKRTINQHIDFNVVIFNCLPNLWLDYIEKYKIKLIGKKLIGYTTWDTTKLSELWVTYCNLMDEVWVPSQFNKEIFERCGVTVPIKIVQYPKSAESLNGINSDSLGSLLNVSNWYSNNSDVFKYGLDWKIFYTIGEWNERENIDGTIKTFCRAFTAEDKVKLIVKVYHIDYTPDNVEYCTRRMEDILKEFPKHPEILLITGNINCKLIHSIGDCFFSMTRSGGFCRSAFDAFSFGKHVIITEFGGHTDYLGKGRVGYITYDLIDVDFEEQKRVYNSDQKWASPNIQHGISKLQNFNSELNRRNQDSPVTLKQGWFFKENNNGVSFRRSDQNPIIIINKPKTESISLKLKNENQDFEKTIELLINEGIKKTITLPSKKSDTVLIPIKNIKKIEISIKGLGSENKSTGLEDTRRSGIILEGVDLRMKDGWESIGIDDIDIENELEDFCILLKKEKLKENVVEEVGSQLKDEVIPPNVGKNISLSKIGVQCDSEFVGITYIGQYGTSGYASAAKGNLYHFFTKGIPVSWIPLRFDNSKLSDECLYNVVVTSLINKPIEKFDTVIIHATPDIWPDICLENASMMSGKKKIGYTVWESSKLPDDWVKKINENVDEVWCPSSYNKSVFENSGVVIPIIVFPHVFLPKELPNRQSVKINVYNKGVLEDESDYYTFYNISELNPRKGVEDLIKTFCETFSEKDKVRLILKIHFNTYEENNKKICIDTINGIMSLYENPPKIHCILDNLSEKQILGLHSIGDCYVSLCKSEGFGLTIFEAHKYGKKIIATGYGGQVDFLNDENSSLVRYTIDKIGDSMKNFNSRFYSSEQEWAYPDLKHAGELMKKNFILKI